MLSTPPTSARLRVTPSIIPAASKAATMLVAQAITVENAGTVGETPASISTSRAMLLHVRLGTTVPQTAKSGAAPDSRPAICLDHGNRERDRVEFGERAVDLGERRAHSGRKPDFGAL